MSIITPTNIMHDSARFSDDEARGSMRVLLVEDDSLTRAILCNRLSLMDIIIETAANGLDGLNKVESFKPDLILSDWMMPEMDGREFCRRIKQEHLSSSIYFILLTAKDGTDNIVSALDTGADEYMVKSIDYREMMARLRAAKRILNLQKALNHSNDKLCQALSRVQQELDSASKIQRSLLPEAFPDINGYSFSAHYQPSTECSGDFYQVLPLGNGTIGIAIGDVSGHGTPAMVAMALVHQLLNQEAFLTSNPAEVLCNMNNKLWTSLRTDQYATLFYGILDPASGMLSYSSAGHNAPLKADFHNRKFEFFQDCAGFPIKLISPGLDYENYQIQLEPGQHFIFYTDGLTEAQDNAGNFFNDQGLISAVQSASQQSSQGILESILEGLNGFLNGVQNQDDISLLILSRH